MTTAEWLLVAITIAGSALPIVWYFRGHHFMYPNVIGILYVFHLLVTVIPAIVFCLEGEKPLARTFLWTCVLAAYLISVGGYLADIIGPRRAGAPASLIGAPFSESAVVQRAAKMFFLGLIVICCLLFANTVSSSSHYPLRDLLTIGDATFYREARREITASGYLQGLSQRFVMPLLFTFAIAHWAIFRKTALWRLLAVFAIALALVANSYAGNKTPTAVLFVLALLLWLHRRALDARTPTAPRRGDRLRKLIFPTLALTGAIGFPLLIYSRLPVGDSYGVLELLIFAVLRRVFLNPAGNSYFAFEIFSSGEPYTYFLDMGKLATLLGLQYYDLSTVISLYKDQGWESNAPPTSIGTFFAQGGLSIVVLGMIFAAFTFRVFENVLVSCRAAPPIYVSIYVMLVFAAFRFSWAYFHTIFLSEMIVPGVLVLLLWHQVCRMQRPRCQVGSLATGRRRLRPTAL